VVIDYKKRQSPTSSWIYGSSVGSRTRQHEIILAMAGRVSHAMCECFAVKVETGVAYWPLIGRPMPTDENRAMDREPSRAICGPLVLTAYTACTKSG
jgi:hypothetical protein